MPGPRFYFRSWFLSSCLEVFEGTKSIVWIKAHPKNVFWKQSTHLSTLWHWSRGHVNMNGAPSPLFHLDNVCVYTRVHIHARMHVSTSFSQPSPSLRWISRRKAEQHFFSFTPLFGLAPPANTLIIEKMSLGLNKVTDFIMGLFLLSQPFVRAGIHGTGSVSYLRPIAFSLVKGKA